MGGGGDKYRFPLTIKEQFVEDIIGLFHHYHHDRDEHKVHHCIHTSGIKIIHCGCKTINGSVQHTTDCNRLDCITHLPDITGITNMELSLSEKCPKLGFGWYHLGTLATKIKQVRCLCRAVG